MKTIAAGLLVLIAAVACFLQFCTDHFGPLGVAAVLLVVAWRIRPSFRWACLVLPLLCLLLLGVDAYALRHQVAVRLRVWAPMLGAERIEDILPSPSRRTVVYIVGDHWLDTSYSAYFSDGGLFPSRAYIATKANDAYYPRDLTARWDGEVFTASEQFLALRYRESDRSLETFTK